MVRWRREGEPNEALPSGLGCLLVAQPVFPAVRGRLKSVCTWGVPLRRALGALVEDYVGIL